MNDLPSSAWMWLKALLLLMIGLVSATVVFLEAPSIKLGLLLCLTVWGFCRAYYFALMCFIAGQSRRKILRW
jgi:hypothetical protein